MIPYSFQKGNKQTGCEDAPPVAKIRYSIICDGLGGSGSTKHLVCENGSDIQITRTSGYLGARIVCSCVDAFYAENFNNFFYGTNRQGRKDSTENLLRKLKKQIVDSFDLNMKKWNIVPSRSKTMKIFPTTLASALYFPCENKNLILAVWAGDSRVYVLSPTQGLQLLSLDDAKNADIEMNSASEMLNCISVSNDFNLNYAFYELTEPGIVFCCSDGCFDYLPSPLNFEWLLLHTILEYLPNSKGNGLGVALADSIRENMYNSIGDDTTMAGIILAMDSSMQMKSLYKTRMLESGKNAVEMNEYLKDLKKVQNEGDDARKKCRLLEERIVENLYREVFFALQQKRQDSMLYLQLKLLPSFSEYSRKEMDISDEIEKECMQEIKKIQEVDNKKKSDCRRMVICDYMKWQRSQEEQNVSYWWGSSVFPPKPREQTQNNSVYMRPSFAKQTIMTCIEVYKHSEIGKFIFGEDSEEDNERHQCIQQLENLLNILNISSDLFADLWSQAYFSTENFAKERFQWECSPEFALLFERALQNPQSCGFVSKLTIQKIIEYNENCTNLDAIKEKYKAEKKQRLKECVSDYFHRNKDEIYDMILSENTTTLRCFFENTSVPIDELLVYIEAKKTLSEIEQKSKEIQICVENIWELYKVKYQLFRLISERGVI